MVHRPDSPYVTEDNLFTGGSPPSIPASRLQAKWLNMVVKEMEAPVLAAGLSLDDTVDDQLMQAIILLGSAGGVMRNNILNPSGQFSTRYNLLHSFDSSRKRTITAAEAVVWDKWRFSSGDGVAECYNVANDVTVPSNPQWTQTAMYTSVTSSSTVAPALKQRMWALRQFSDKTLRLRFMALGSGSVSVTPKMRVHFGSGGSASADITVASEEGACAVTTSWTSFDRSFVIPDISASDQDGVPYVELIMELPTGATYAVTWAQFQVESRGVYSDHGDIQNGPQLERLILSQFCQSSFPFGLTPDLTGITSGQVTAQHTFSGGANEYIYSLNSELRRMRSIPTVRWFAPSNQAEGYIDIDGTPHAVNFVSNASFTRTGSPVVTGAPVGVRSVAAHYIVESEV